jgi:minor histocompatibility antigen H13
MKFPLMGSIMLFSLFLAFKFLPKDLVNLVLSAYFVLLGTAAIVATADPIVGAYLPSSLSREFTIKFPKIPVVLKEGGEVTFTALEAILAVPAGVFCGWYWTTKHWMANNILGLAFSLQGIEHLSLGAVQNGVILLGGLFFYDVFWVFCTPVMVSVAKSFDAPIKLLFPRVPFPAAAAASKFSMLGLGDIVIPGVFVAIVLRYDIAHGDGSPRFFKSAFLGYSAGLAATIAVMNIFQAAQPALLYIVPAVLLTTFAHAAATGQASHLFHWKETEEEEEETAAVVAEAKKES